MYPKLIELEKQFQPSILTQIFDPLLERKAIELWVKRDDLIHPVISGNKWRKLKYIVDNVLNQGCHTLISMGGAYSNHLHALAYVAKKLDIKAIGYIRGEQPEILSPTLRDIQEWGMELRFISRTEYKNLRAYKGQNDLPGLQQGQYWLPEGGAVKLALQGVGELVSEIDTNFNVICVPCGSGATLAGIINAASDSCLIYGFSALKGADFLTKDVAQLIPNTLAGQDNWTIRLEYHCGGFAKKIMNLCYLCRTLKISTI